jgi:hypothetical protein
VSFVEYLNIPGGKQLWKSASLSDLENSVSLKNKVSKSFVRPFVQPMGRIFGGFPQLSVSLINEKTEINMRMDTHSRLSVTGRHRSCAKSRHEKADWIVVGSFFQKTRNGNFFIGKKKVHVTDARMGFSQVRASGRSETATRSRCSPASSGRGTPLGAPR